MKKYFYLVKKEINSINVDFTLLCSYKNRDNESGYYRISKKLAESLHLKCRRDDSCIEDIRIDSVLGLCDLL